MAITSFIATVRNGEIVFPVLMEDPIIHTDARPFCSDHTCGCHADELLLEEFVFAPLRHGLLTMDEALRLAAGKQV